EAGAPVEEVDRAAAELDRRLGEITALIDRLRVAARAPRDWRRCPRGRTTGHREARRDRSSYAHERSAAWSSLHCLIAGIGGTTGFGQRIIPAAAERHAGGGRDTPHATHAAGYNAESPLCAPRSVVEAVGWFSAAC